jgi:hypothetical protein
MQFSPVNPGPRWTEELPVSLAAVSSSISQANNTNPEFGQGLKRYSKRYAAGITDQVLGKVMTEALYPTLFREDPLYFRINGSVKSRLLWAVERTVATKTNSGNATFNFAEWVGNGTVAAQHVFIRASAGSVLRCSAR